MRVQLALVCMALCLGVSMAGPWGRSRGRGGWSFGCSSVCALVNDATSVNTTADCRYGFECGSDSVNFEIQSTPYSASFCSRPADETDAEEEVDTGKFVKALIKRACNLVNTTSGEVLKSRPCRGGLNCSLGEVSVQKDGTTLAATYCQDESETPNWLEVFNGEQRDASSFFSRFFSGVSAWFERRRGRRGAGRRGGRRGGRRFGGPCNITDIDGVAIEESACPEESTCTVGPLAADEAGEPINIFFCERADESSSSSSSEDDDDAEADFIERIGKRLFSNACELSVNETSVDRVITCDAEANESCAAGPFTIEVGSTEIIGNFCTNGEDFSLIQALQQRRPRGGRGPFRGGPPRGGFSRGGPPRGGPRGGRRG